MHKLFYILMLSLLISSCARRSEIEKTETQTYSVNSELTSVDSNVLKITLPFKDEMEKEMSETLAQSTSVFEKGLPESKLGNFVSDLCLELSNEYLKDSSDFCFLNNGGLRSPLPKGEITRRDVFELMPFENELVQLTLSGETTKELIDFIAVRGGVPVSGIKMIIKDKQAFNIFIKGEAFDPQRTYKVITSDYLANGGDDLEFLSKTVFRKDVGLKVRDAIILYLQRINSEGKILTAALDGRIKYE